MGDPFISQDGIFPCNRREKEGGGGGGRDIIATDGAHRIRRDSHKAFVQFCLQSPGEAPSWQAHWLLQPGQDQPVCHPVGQRGAQVREQCLIPAPPHLDAAKSSERFLGYRLFFAEHNSLVLEHKE